MDVLTPLNRQSNRNRHGQSMPWAGLLADVLTSVLGRDVLYNQGTALSETQSGCFGSGKPGLYNPATDNQRPLLWIATEEPLLVGTVLRRRVTRQSDLITFADSEEGATRGAVHRCEAKVIRWISFLSKNVAFIYHFRHSARFTRRSLCNKITEREPLICKMSFFWGNKRNSSSDSFPR